jgi:hypothetical protein
MEYNIDNVFFNKSGIIFSISEDKCKQIWNITFRKPINNKVNLQDLSLLLSDENFGVCLTLKTKMYLLVSTIFEKDENPYGHDRSVGRSFKLFKELENNLGQIDTIEGQKIEERWSPWMQDAENKY